MILVFSTTNALHSRLVRAFTWSHFSHVDLLDESTGRLYGAVPFKGVISRSMSDLRKQSSKIEMYKITAEYDEELILDNIKSQLGKRYDWPAVLGFVLRTNIEKRNRWFCSELVSWVFLPQVKFLKTDPYRISPEDLLESPYLEKIETV